MEKKRYKHKQTGLIAIQIPLGTNYSICGYNSEGHLLACCETIRNVYIENTQDWEEIVEEEWEITAFRSLTKLKTIWRLQKNGSYKVNSDDYSQWNLHHFLDLDKKTEEIYSVKRLSDNQEFKIGDKIILYDKQIVILGYFSTDSEGWIGCTQPGIYGGPWKIGDIKLVKQPLFTTFDSVEIFEGDECYYVNNIDLKMLSSIKGTYGLVESVRRNTNNNYGKYFSTKEKAEEFIVMNKPCLSIKEVESNLYFKQYKDGREIHGSKTKSTLYRLVKSKLNL